MRKYWAVFLLAILLASVLPVNVFADSAEEVYVQQVMDLDSKLIIVRSNGVSYLLEYGVGVISLPFYEGKKIIIYSPGMFAGIGSKIILPDRGQEARIWNSTIINTAPILPPIPQQANISQRLPIIKKNITNKTIVAVPLTTAYASPIAAAQNILGPLYYGTELVIQSSGKYWHEVAFENGTMVFYVPSTILTSYKPIQSKVIAIKTETGFITAAPSEKSTVFGSLPKGFPLLVLGEAGNWFYVFYLDQNNMPHNGFISKTVAW